MDTQQDEKRNLSKGGGAPCEPTSIHILYPTVVIMKCRTVLSSNGNWADVAALYMKVNGGVDTYTTYSVESHAGTVMVCYILLWF